MHSCLVLLVCLSLPPWIRYLPGFVVVVGVIPGPKPKNCQVYMQVVADQFDALHDGIYAMDAVEGKQVIYCDIFFFTM